MRFIKYTLIISAVILLSGACRKIQHLPPEPHIEFTSFTVFDTTDILGNFSKGGRLRFRFEDGDGDLGLRSAESGVLDTTNLFFTLFRKTGGVMEQVPDDDLMKPSSYRIPFIEKVGNNSILKGTISVSFIYFFYEPASNDTIMYEFYLQDRDLNASNTESTAEIPLSENNTYVKPE